MQLAPTKVVLNLRPGTARTQVELAEGTRNAISVEAHADSAARPPVTSRAAWQTGADPPRSVGVDRVVRVE
jgi:hypothetical protein